MHKQPYFIMCHPFADGCRMMLYVGGTSCQNNKFAIKEAYILRHLCVVIVMLEGYLRYLHSLISEMVGGSLLHSCGVVGRQFMCEDVCYEVLYHHWLV